MLKSKDKLIEKIRKGEIDVKRDLLGANLEKQDLQGLSFAEAIMMGSSFSGSNLKNAKFRNASLMGADFSNSILVKADFRYSAAMGAHFDHAEMREADLRYASFGGAFLPEAKCGEADFRACMLSRANFEKADLTKSKLEDAILTEANLVNANLTDATVRNTDFTRADLLGAKLKGIRFDDRSLRTVIDSYNWDRAEWDEKTKAEAIKRFDRLEAKPIEIPKDTSPHKLYVKCRTCGIEFYAGVETNPKSFATSVYRGNIHKCPKGHMHAYDKEDYILRKVETLPS